MLIIGIVLIAAGGITAITEICSIRDKPNPLAVSFLVVGIGLILYAY